MFPLAFIIFLLLNRASKLCDPKSPRMAKDGSARIAYHTVYCFFFVFYKIKIKKKNVQFFRRARGYFVTFLYRQSALSNLTSRSSFFFLLLFRSPSDRFISGFSIPWALPVSFTFLAPLLQRSDSSLVVRNHCHTTTTV